MSLQLSDAELQAAAIPLGETELAEIKAREEAAKPGPWTARPYEDCGRLDPERCDGIVDAEGYAIVKTDSGVYPPEQATAEFIAHARTDVPRLIAEVRRLRTEATSLMEHRNAELAEMYKTAWTALGEPADTDPKWRAVLDAIEVQTAELRQLRSRPCPQTCDYRGGEHPCTKPADAGGRCLEHRPE